MPHLSIRRQSTMRPRRRKLLVSLAIASLAIATTLPASAAGPGVLTAQDEMLEVTAAVTAAGGWAKAIITTGEMVDSYRFESIPDGISIWKNGNGTVDAYVNHETSRVPFPLAANGSSYVPTTNSNGSQNDFLNSQVSKLRLSQQTAGVLSGSYVIDSGAGFQRFCSNFLATVEHGFKKPILFTSEEGVDWVKESDPTFPAFPGDSDARQIGAVVAYDVKAGIHKPIWGMGRFNHENTMAVPLPSYGKPVFISGDDTFTTTTARSQSQLYMYTADNSSAVWNDQGKLWAFVSDDPTKQRYEDFAPGDTTSIAGHFIEVPKLIATGKWPDGRELMAADVPEYDGTTFIGGPATPVPSTNWQTFNGAGIDGPQWALEWWSRENDVFGFIRVEDTAYDKRPGMSNHLYIVDSGRGTNAAVAQGVSSNGRVWEMVLNPQAPTQVTSLRILIEGDDQMVKHPGRIHQPDNIESTAAGLYLTEDPGSQQHFPFGSINPLSGNYNADATNARIWQYKFAHAITDPVDGDLAVVAVVDQSLDEASGYDVDTFVATGGANIPAAAHGFWEASGIIDVSSVYGPGTFLVTVQAHSLWVDKSLAPDSLTRSGGVWSYGADTYPDWVNKREGGQLLLIKIPGG